MPYIGRTTDGFGVRNRFVYLASSGDTSVSGADANGATLTFTDGAYVDVYLNGVLLKPTTDYNTSTAGTIAGLSALNTNDEVTVVVYDVFTVADMVSATSGGTFSGNVTFGGGTGAITSTGIIKTDDTTEATSTTDGSLQTDGGLSVAKDAVFGDDVKLLSDSAVLSFGADNDITLTHNADTGLILKNTNTGDNSTITLALQTGEQVIETDDVLGKIEFQAPDETSGTDAVEIVGDIRVRAESDFSATSNATSLEFRTAINAAARLMMALNSDGTLKLGMDNQSAAQALRCHNNSGSATIQARNSNGGNMVFQGLNLNGSQSSTISESGVGYFANGVSSDETLKNVKGVVNDGWSKLKNIQPKSFTWKKITYETNEEGKEVEVKSDDDLDGNIHYGVMAQDLKKVIPELAYGEEGGMSVDYNGLLMIAINTIKELEARIEALESK